MVSEAIAFPDIEFFVPELILAASGLIIIESTVFSLHFGKQ